MGVRIRIFMMLVGVAAAGPATVNREPNIDHFADLSAESSEVVEVSVPSGLRKDNQAAASEHSIELVGGSQTFFPSFANLFEPRQQNLRLGFGNQETAYSQRPNSYRSLLNYPLFSNYRNLDSFSKQNNAAAPVAESGSSSILGSGNFGVIRGGTFFQQNDGDEYDGFSSYYNNGHGRPSLNLGYTANPRPNYNQDQFANFRDFADINTPSNTAFSHFVVVYANKNATVDEVSEETKNVASEPKNIFETLEMLDKIESKTPKSETKISKSKAKLAKSKLKMMKKKEQWKMSSKKAQLSNKHELEEPLLALS